MLYGIDMAAVSPMVVSLNRGIENLRSIWAVLPILALPNISAPQDYQDVPPAVPVDPVSAIIDALETHQIVALGDWHYNVELHELRLELIRDSRFARAVKNIVVEFGAGQHQDIIDRYVNGLDVPRDELRRVWTETPFGDLWDGRVYEEFYRVVREVNSDLPRRRRLRVILGGSPMPFTMEGEAALIKEAIANQERNALIVWGAMHLPRKPLFYPVSDPDFAEFAYSHPDSVSTVAHLQSTGVSVFSIWPKAIDEFLSVQPDIQTWDMPALTLVDGTILGVEPFATFANTDTMLMVPDADGDGMHGEHVPPDPARSGLTQDQFDAVLLLGLQESLREEKPYNSAQAN